MTREGIIEKIIYKNDENGYAVFSVNGEDGEEVFVGTLFGIGEGLYIIAEGDYVNHPQYDIQFKFTSCEIKMPDDTLGIERYLASGIVKGIGEVLAKRIVKKFKADTLRILEEEPERLAEINGISERKARSIAVSYQDKKEFQHVIIFLSEYGISVNLAMKIYNEYGDRVYEILRGNPYKIAEDIAGVGFRTADEIAGRMGIEKKSEFRIRSAVIYVLNTAIADGHMYLPKDEVIRRTLLLTRENDGISYEEEFSYGYAEYESSVSAATVFEEAAELIEDQLAELVIEGKLIIKNVEGTDAVYLASNYYVELNTARMLLDKMLRYELPENELDIALSSIEKDMDMALDDVQRDAVKSAITAGVAVITGGPGTGKTTIIDAIIRYFIKKGMDIRLCAPTGRAAKRMTESTGQPAETIHRLLEFSGIPDDNDRDNKGVYFGRNADNPLECDAIIVDEMSMVDSFIFYSLLSAVLNGTRLILVGDINQLPSVGAGNVLKDIINSDCFPVTRLTKIYRQESGSDIVYNAHRINQGEHIDITNKNKDFFFIPRNNVTAITNEIKELIMKNLPPYLGITPQDIQVLTPMKKNEVGVEKLNVKLQSFINPASPKKDEVEKNDVIFRTGDKVMQIKNNYKLDWRIYGQKGYVIEEGVGVFNGDMGIISNISHFDEELTVLFDDGRTVVYPFNGLSELEHAFAVTIHKSQGSEYPVVIIPLLSGPPKLLNRNLIYTAITRAKRMVVIVGNLNLVNQMIDNKEEQKRYTTLILRLQELMEGI